MEKEEQPPTSDCIEKSSAYFLRIEYPKKGKSSWKACYSFCQENSNCILWSFQKPPNDKMNGGLCHILSKKENIKGKYGLYVSGHKNCTQKLKIEKILEYRFQKVGT